MPKLSTDGIEDLERKLQEIGQGLRGEAVARALKAGGEVLVRSWQNEIEAKHPGTGTMKGAVAMTEIRYDGDGASIEVYPMGTDSHRITNAQKAYILHYGRNPNRRGKKAIKGDKFVSSAERAAKGEALAAMQAAFDEYIAGKE